jgi:hypothetical protein
LVSLFDSVDLRGTTIIDLFFRRQWNQSEGRSEGGLVVGFSRIIEGILFDIFALCCRFGIIVYRLNFVIDLDSGFWILDSGLDRKLDV